MSSKRIPANGGAEGEAAEPPGYLPLSEYGLIGDCHGAALVSRDGAIDWACLSRFDAGSIFGRILDARAGGTFALSPRGRARVTRRYLPDTNVLETRFQTGSGTARVLDCFTMRTGGRRRPRHQILRVVEGVEGEVAFDVLVEPRFDYASVRPWVRFHRKDRVYTAVGGADAFVLSADCDLAIDSGAAVLRGEVTVRARQRCRFSLVSQRPHKLSLARPSARTLDGRLRETILWWRSWVKKGRRFAVHSEAVNRSALVLKLLTCAPTGGIIAAPTTSLPERIGGARNWDYRYVWVRDATLTLASLLDAGHPEVAAGFKQFIERATAGRAEDLQIMYGCYGERRLPEVELALEGYRGSRPVRIGNAASTQRQLDVYGELLQAAHLWRRAGSPITAEGWTFLSSLVEAACAHWAEPDRGIWEVRGQPRHYVHSKVMCWVALERGLQAATEQSLPCEAKRWRSVRDEIRLSIEQNGIDPVRGCFVQSYGSRELDASLLLLPVVGFVGAADPRMKKTVEAILEDLVVDGLVQRYRPSEAADGLAGGEGAFLMASFWLVDVLAMQGRIEEAERRFAHVLSLGNDLGLFAEEYDPVRKELLGNFPQAFTHLALIHSAAQLEQVRASGGAPALPTADRTHLHSSQRLSGATLHHAPRRQRTARR